MRPALVVAIDRAVEPGLARKLERALRAAVGLVSREAPALAYAWRRSHIGEVPSDAVDGGQLRDFLAATLVAQGAATPGDMLATGRPAGLAHEDGAADVALRSWLPPGGNRTLLEPPPLRIRITVRDVGPRLVDLLAARLVCEPIARAAKPGAGGSTHDAAAQWIERRLEPLAADAPAGGSSNIADTARHGIDELLAWIAAWRGMALGDVARLERARELLDRIAHARGPDARDPAELPRLLGDLAVVCLALGGTAEGSRRLSEGLAAARAGLSLCVEHNQTERAAGLAAVAGRIAGALGARHGDVMLVEEAIILMHRAERLASGPWVHAACGTDGLMGERAALSALRSRLNPRTRRSAG